MNKAEKSKLWFKAKEYGWGWVPASREGWYVLLGFILAVMAGSLLLGQSDPDTFTPVIAYMLWVAFCVGVLIKVCYAKGEKPRWRWGGKDGSN